MPKSALAPVVRDNLKNRDLLEERRRQLVDAATEVFADRGFDRATVNEIAERCKWSVGALYRYVTTKDDILFLVCEEIFRRIGPAALDNLPDVEPDERFAQAWRVLFDNIARQRRQVLLMYREYGRLSPDAQRYFKEQEAKVVQVFRQIIAAGVKRKTFTCPDPELFAIETVMAAHSIALKGWVVGNRTPIEVRERILAWMLRGLGN